MENILPAHWLVSPLSPLCPLWDVTEAKHKAVFHGAGAYLASESSWWFSAEKVCTWTEADHSTAHGPPLLEARREANFNSVSISNIQFSFRGLRGKQAPVKGSLPISGESIRPVCYEECTMEESGRGMFAREGD
ncbi:hypothetical protein INR49_021712 [Caranx melampygus]|nr:hypothetical protein INR49_021712 [Caranx melampygus]